MSIVKQLHNQLRKYDPYGEHLVNGLKAVFILELLFLFNYVYTVTNPFFYFFFVPMSAFAAEIAGKTLQQKYIFLFFTIMGSTLAIFLFGVFSTYKTFFIFFIFAYSLLIYFTAIYKLHNMSVPAPLILSIAIYSLIYNNSNSNFYIALNHALQSITAMLIMFAGLILFSKKYYLTIWYRAFSSVLSEIQSAVDKITNQQMTTMPIISGTLIMEQYANMLSRRMSHFSVLKITLITFELITQLAAWTICPENIKITHQQLFASHLQRFTAAVKLKHPLTIQKADFPDFYALQALYKLILSWNYLCHKL